MILQEHLFTQKHLHTYSLQISLHTTQLTFTSSSLHPDTTTTLCDLLLSLSSPQKHPYILSRISKLDYICMDSPEIFQEDEVDQDDS